MSGDEAAADDSENTQRFKVPSFVPVDPKTRRYRPYAFSKLEKVTKTEGLLVRRLAWIIPGVSAEGTVQSELLERLKGLLETDVDLKIDYVHVIAPRDLKRYVAEPTFLAVLAPLPHQTRGLLEVELSLAHRAIDQLLGGTGEMSTLRPLTEIEDAVMSFMVLEFLKTLAPHLDPGLPRLRLERLARKVDEAAELVANEAHLVAVQFKMVLGGHSGFVRLFLPESVLRMASAPAATVERTTRQMESVRQHLSRLHGFKAWMRVEIGRSEVSSDDLAALEPRSVVLLDELTAMTHKGEGGTARMKVGLGHAGTLDAEVYLEEGRYFTRVTGIRLGNSPLMPRTPTATEDEAAEMLANDGEAPEAAAPEFPLPAGSISESETTSPHGLEARALDETNEGVELLSDIPLQIVVELARVPVTADEIVSLRVGQVFDLNRLPGEPVELSVNGKVVARGELVEVEGHLGVRILALMG